MKKTTRSLLVTALILFCAGLLLALSCSLYAKIAGIEVFDIKQKARTIESITVSLDEILSLSPESNFMKKLSKNEFSKVDISSFAGDVKICANAEKTELILDKANTNNISFAIVGDTLTIHEVDAVGFMGIYIDENGFSFKGLRHIFSPGNRINSGKTVTLNLSKDVQLDQIDIVSSVGDVECDGINAAAVNVKTSIGDVTIKNAANQNSKFKIIGDFADVHLENNLYTSCAVSAKFGDIDAHVAESVGQSTILDLWCGDVNVKTDLPTSYYKLNLSTTIGEIHRNDKKVGKELNEPGSTASRISSGILMGDFDLSYSGSNEEDYKPKTD